MKTQIRKNVFETNSSSTHAINIYKGNKSKYEIPTQIYIKAGEFGWEDRIYNDPESKLSYLYTYCISKCITYDENYIEHFNYKKLKDYQYKIKSQLEQIGVEEIIFEDFENSWYYIDHVDELGNSLDDVLNNYFLDFVFNDKSEILTGNDNSDYERCYEDPQADWSFYKGN